MADLVSAINTVRTLIGLAKDAHELNIQRHLVELQAQLLEADREINSLKEALAQLQNARETGDDLRFQHHCYWFHEYGSSEGHHVGPFCSRCWDVDTKLVRMHTTGELRDGMCGVECPHCKAGTTVPKQYFGRQWP